MVDDCVTGERTGTPTRLCRISNASSRPSRAQIQSLLATERREERTRHGSARSQHQTRRPKFRLHRASSARPFERVAGTASCGHHLCCCVSCCLLAVQCTPAQSIGVRGNIGPCPCPTEGPSGRTRRVDSGICVSLHSPEGATYALQPTDGSLRNQCVRVTLRLGPNVL